MELKTQTVDKILEALTPALSAELERVLQEARQQQEEEFRKRFEAAIHDAEEAVTQLAEAEKEKALAELRAKITAEFQAQQEQAITDARADTREKVSTDMRNAFQETLRQTIDQLGADFARQSEAAAGHWEAEKCSLQDQVNLWRVYAEAQQQLSESGSQAEMLTRFLNLVEPFAGAVAVYVAKADGLALWKSRGKGAFSELVSRDTIDPESFFKALVVRERTVAAVCAVPPYKAESIDFLSSCLGRAIEGFGLKLKTPVPRTPAAAAAATAPPAAVPANTVSIPNEKLAAEARLAARLLVSEIKLYNEQDVREGRAASDLYSRLQKQIDQGREQYRQRIDTGAVSRDYYHEELVRVLADGEATRLGSDYPGPMNP